MNSALNLIPCLTCCPSLPLLLPHTSVSCKYINLTTGKYFVSCHRKLVTTNKSSNNNKLKCHLSYGNSCQELPQQPHPPYPFLSLSPSTVQLCFYDRQMNVVSISICVSLIWLCPNSRLMATTGQLARPTWFWPFPMCIIGQLLSLAVASRFMARHRRSTQIFVADWSSSHKASMNTSLASVFPPLSFTFICWPVYQMLSMPSLPPPSP